MTTSKPCFRWGPNFLRGAQIPRKFGQGGPNLGGQISWDTVSKYAYRNEHNNLYSVHQEKG